MGQNVVAADLVVQRVEADSRALPSLSRATPSAASEHSSELIGCPISRSLATCCVCLEPRPLPSTGITRLHRYYEPLRHPKAPGLSVTGVRLVVPDHAKGLPVLRALSLCTCCRHYPGTATGGTASLIRPVDISLPRKGRRVGLRIDLFEACSAFTRVTARTLALPPIRGTLTRRLQPFRYLHDCSGCFRLERLPGGTCTHWKAPPFHGAHPERLFELRVLGNTDGRRSSDRLDRDHGSICIAGSLVIVRVSYNVEQAFVNRVPPASEHEFIERR